MLCLSVVHAFSLPGNVLLCKNTTFCLSSRLLVGIWLFSVGKLLGRGRPEPRGFYHLFFRVRRPHEGFRDFREQGQPWWSRRAARAGGPVGPEPAWVRFPEPSSMRLQPAGHPLPVRRGVRRACGQDRAIHALPRSRASPSSRRLSMGSGPGLLEGFPVARGYTR